jgi:hypothetical protein
LAVEYLARLHASWWNHPLLGSDIGAFPSQEERQEEWAEAEDAVARFLSATRGKLQEQWRCTFGSLPELYKRHVQGKNFDLSHVFFARQVISCVDERNQLECRLLSAGGPTCVSCGARSMISLRSVLECKALSPEAQALKPIIGSANRGLQVGIGSFSDPRT